MIETLKLALANKEYEKVIKECKLLLQKDNENAKLWYYLFLAENNNFFEFDKNNIKDEMAINEAFKYAQKEEKEKYINEYNINKYNNNNLVRKLIRYASLFQIKEMIYLLESIQDFSLYKDAIEENYFNDFSTYLSNNENKKILELNLIILNIFKILTNNNLLISKLYYQQFDLLKNQENVLFPYKELVNIEQLILLLKIYELTNNFSIDSTIKRIKNNLFDAKIEEALSEINQLLQMNLNENQKEIYLLKILADYEFTHFTDLLNLNESINNQYFQIALNDKNNIYQNVYELINNYLIENIYKKETNLLLNGVNSETIDRLEDAIDQLETIKDYKDSLNYIKNYQNKLNSLNEKIKINEKDKSLNGNEILRVKELFTYKIYNTFVEIVKCNKNDSTIIVPKYIEGKKVKIIGEKAFSLLSKVKKIILPNSIKKLNHGAFFNMYSLINIKLSSNLEVIDNCAFERCRYLKEIIIPSNVKIINRNAFNGCENLKKVLFEKNSKCKIIGDFAFNGCKKLKDINLPNEIVEVGVGVFYMCSSLDKFVFPEKVNCIPESFFTGTALKQIIIPDNILKINSHAFAECRKVKKIVLGNNVESIYLGAFSGCMEAREIYIPKGINYIAGLVFLFCNHKHVVYCAEKEKPNGWENSWDNYNFLKGKLNVIWDFKMK